MQRWLYAYHYVEAEPEAIIQVLLERAPELVQYAAGAPKIPTDADGSFVMDVETAVAGIDLAKQVRVSLGVAHRPDHRLVIPLRWHAEPLRRLFPSFEGTLEVEPHSSRLAQLILDGAYTVPLGAVGVVADAAALGRYARKTAERLVTAVAREVTRAVRVTATPPKPAPTHQPNLQVRDVMTPNPLTLDEDLPVRSAALLLFHAGISGAPVVAADGELLGVVSERDLMAKEARRASIRTVGEACTRPARVTVPDAPLAAAAGEMLDARVGRLVVVDGAQVAGIVTRHDLLAALIREDAELQAAVENAIDRLDVPSLQVTAIHGTVHVKGAVAYRSEAERLTASLQDIDGVMEVDTSRMSWLHDDVTVRPPVPL